MMRNPLPVDPFNAADAVRRTWPQLIESMLEAVCLVEPGEMRIVAANAQAGRLHGQLPAALVGQDMRDLAATPEDHVFWREVADGRWTGLVSDSHVAGPGGSAVPVTRRVSRVEPAPGTVLYVVAWHDRSVEVGALRHAEASQADLQATLESLGDGVLVLDLSGHIAHFNRRFAALWSLPGEMLALRADDEIFDWMRIQVADPRAYGARLAEIDADAALHAADRVALREGGVLERVTAPQTSRGRLIGRVYTFRAVPGA